MAESEIVRATLKSYTGRSLAPRNALKALNEVKKVLHSIQEHSSEFENFAI